MNPLAAKELLHWLGERAQLRECAARADCQKASAALSELSVSQLATDSRKVDERSLFVALKGERHDAHAYLQQVADLGCQLAIVRRGAVSSYPETLSVLEVPDTLEALHLIAQNYRRTLTAPVIAVTGSSGKTSTKQLLGAALGPLGPVQVTRGNLNNHIGLPLTVLEGEDIHAAHVWEMGMNHPGEIAPLAAIAAAQVGVITNIGSAHIEHMGTKEAIAREKAELLMSLPESGLAVLPAGDAFLPLLEELTPCRVLRAGFGQEADYRVVDFHPHADGSSFVLSTPHGDFALRLPALGRHMAANASLAVAVAMEQCSLDAQSIATALEEAQIGTGRLQIINLGQQTIIDDSYNANPDSVAAALRTLAELPAKQSRARRIAVLGRMAELGDFELAAYRQIADLAAELELDALHTVGPQWAEALERSRHPLALCLHETLADCQQVLEEQSRPGDMLLVKGSRAAAMEQLVAFLRQALCP